MFLTSYSYLFHLFTSTVLSETWKAFLLWSDLIMVTTVEFESHIKAGDENPRNTVTAKTDSSQNAMQRKLDGVG